ncbi:hypothetical protein MYX06_01945 [Patescibacteria group bacterium AH-259-L05]|nr:hypothetical protein [Patescibacteria group bacterium AH-259-L05]
MKRKPWPNTEYKEVSDKYAPAILALYEGHPFQPLIRKRIFTTYAVIKPFNVRRTIAQDEYINMLKGLSAKELPKILAQCEDKQEARTVLHFATTIALHTGSEQAAVYAAKVGLAYRTNDKQTELTEIFSDLTSWAKENPDKRIAAGNVISAAKQYLSSLSQ